MPEQRINEKLASMSQFLDELRKYEHISYEEFKHSPHYAIECLIELLVIYASDILIAVLTARKEELPTTLRTTFLRAAELSLLPQQLAEQLADAAGMRNLLAHAYAKVDLKIVFDSISPAIEQFAEFIAVMGQLNGLIEPDEPA